MRRATQAFITIITILFFTIHAAAASPEIIELSNGEQVKVFFEEYSGGYKYEVEFENGHTYFYEFSGNMGHGGGSLELTNEEMILAEEAIEKYEQLNGNATATSNSSSGGPIGIILMLIGLLLAVFPYGAWYLEIGWRLKDAEPSDLALIVNRVGGILIGIVGLFILL